MQQEENKFYLRLNKCKKKDDKCRVLTMTFYGTIVMHIKKMLQSLKFCILNSYDHGISKKNHVMMFLTKSIGNINQ